MNKDQKLTQEQVASMLLWALWRSIHDEYKMKYPRNIWEQFENAIRSAAYTSNLKGFLSLFQRRIPLQLQAQHSKEVKAVVDSGQDEEILDWLRTETTYMMLLVRVENQNRKDAYKASQEEKEENQ